MNRLRNIVLFIVSSFLLGNSPNWADDPGEYLYISTINAQIISNEISLGNSEGDMFAAFGPDGSIRGIGTWLEGIDEPFWEIQVRSDNEGEQISFKYYSASDDQIYNIIEDYQFSNNEVLGDAIDPIIYNLKPYVILSYDNITSTSFDIVYNSNINIKGFQFDIEGVEIEGCSGGAAEDVGFIVEEGNETVIGFSLSGAVIYAGNEVLITINHSPVPYSEVIIDSATFSADEGEEIPNNAPISFDIGVFDYNQSTQQAFYYFNSVTLNGQELDSLDWIGVFNGDVCVGARQWDLSNCNGGNCDVPAMGADAQPETAGYMNIGNYPSFKIYDRSENMFYDAMPSENLSWGPNAIQIIDQLSYLAGCSDISACNYDENVTDDDGSCTYTTDDDFDCEGSCTAGEDCEGVCGGSAVDDECGVCGGDNSSCADCAGVPNGNAEDLGCGCGEPAPGECGCDDLVDLGCGCGEAGPSGCDNTCGSDLVDDECGVCGGDSSSCTDCAGVPNGNSQIDECGVCDDDLSNDCICDSGNYDQCGVCDGDNSSCLDCAGVPNGDAEDLGCGCGEAGPSGCDDVCGSTLQVDNCGICGGDNSQCWYIDILANINDEVNDHNSRIGMHIAASDGYNDSDVEGIDCLDCYKDKIDLPMGQPQDNFDLYFPRPEWEDDIPAIHQTTNLEDDIRHYEEFSFSDFDASTVIISNQTVYYPQQIWDIEISSDIQNIDVGPDGEGGGIWAANTVTMQFDFTNQFSQSDFTKAFVYLETDEGLIIEEITNGDTFSIDDYISPKSVKIIIGWDSSTMPDIKEIISPKPNQIFALDGGPLQLVLDIDQDHLVESLDIFLEIDNIFSDTVNITSINNFLIINADNFNDFLNQNIEGDFNNNITLHVELTDVGGVSASSYPGEGYRRSSSNLLFSRNTSTTSFSTGWNLLAPSLEANHDLETIFEMESYECSVDCNPILTANLGQGFYVRSYGENPSYTFTGEVLSNYSLYIDQGWNLIGNPLVRGIDLSEIRVHYNGHEFTWFEASENGIVAPNPIIYDNSKASHIGIKSTDIIGKAEGFWVNSKFDDVELVFDPVNGFSQEIISKYWDISLFSKEFSGTTGNISDFDEATGSEVIIGVNELGDDEFVYGQDQNQLLINNMNIFNSKYSLLEIENDGNSSIYKDIRSFHDTLLEWDISLNSKKFTNTEGIMIKWDIREYNQLYDNAYKFYLNTMPDSVCQTSLDASNKDFCYNMELIDKINMQNDGKFRVTAVLDEQYIGCAYEENELGISCGNLDCLGGNQNEMCNFSGLSFVDENDPSVFLTHYETNDEDFNLSIALNNAQGLDIEGIQFILEYDVNALSFSDNALVFSDILIDNGYTRNIDTSIPGKFLVSLYASTNVLNIPDNEKIFSLIGSAKEMGQTEIYFSYININDDETSFGEGLTIIFKTLFYKVESFVKYYSSNFEIPYVNISGSLSPGESGPSFSGQTDLDGELSVELVEVELNDIGYGIHLSKSTELNIEESYYDGLSAVDASRIARYALNNYDFNSEQLLAANVTLGYRCLDNNGGFDTTMTSKSVCESNEGYEFIPNVTIDDAARVAKYAAGIHPFLNLNYIDNTEECNPNWIFIDSLQAVPVIENNGMCDDIYGEGVFSNIYDLSLSSDTSLVFSGIRLGDVTGNWNTPNLSRDSGNGRSDSPIVDAELNDIINLPIYLPNEREIEGVDMIVQFDPEVFKLLGFSDRNTILDRSIYKTIINTDIKGEFRLVSYANLSPIKNNGLIGSLKFEVIGTSSSISEIIIDELDVNEISEGGFLIQNGENIGDVALGYKFSLVSIPSEFALNQNFPNPFNPSTNIQFDLPEAGEVKIAIFDVKGSLVEELANTYLDAGYHKLTWNASNQASGMYFLQMIADDGQYVKISKMMLMK